MGRSRARALGPDQARTGVVPAVGAASAANATPVTARRMRLSARLKPLCKGEAGGGSTHGGAASGGGIAGVGGLDERGEVEALLAGDGEVVVAGYRVEARLARQQPQVFAVRVADQVDGVGRIARDDPVVAPGEGNPAQALGQEAHLQPAAAVVAGGGAADGLLDLAPAAHAATPLHRT